MHQELPASDPAASNTDEARASAEALPRIWRELDAHDWPARSFARRLPQLLDLAPDLSAAHRCGWLDGLRRTWRRHGWALRRAHVRQFLELAVAWCDWPLAAAIGDHLAAACHLDDDCALMLMQTYRQLGDADKANDLAVTRQLAKPRDERYAAAHRELIEWRAWRDAWGRIDGDAWGDAELTLEPLAHHHLADFAWQYRDASIASLCRLPTFRDDEHWHDWLDETYRLGNQRTDAVIHHDLGFIGSVSLIQHGVVGFFYYWLGPDFQGRGFGPRAVALLLAAAEAAWGLECCYAKAYQDNTRSRRALGKLGFEELGISAVAPDDDELFYRRGVPAPKTRIVCELHSLLAAMDSDTRAAALIAPQRDR